MGRHLRRHAEHDVEHALRQPRVLEAARQGDAGAGRLFRWLDDAATAGGERARHLADRRDGGEIPGREGGDGADRLLQHHLAHAGRPARDDPAIGTLAFFGVPVGDVGARQHLDPRLGENLTFLQAQRPGDLVGALPHQVGGLPQDRAAVVGGSCAPRHEGTLGGGQRAVEIASRGVRKIAEHLLGRRIDDRFRLALAAGAPFAVDQHFQIFIHCALHGFVFKALLSGSGPGDAANGISPVNRRAGHGTHTSAPAAYSNGAGAEHPV